MLSSGSHVPATELPYDPLWHTWGPAAPRPGKGAQQRNSPPTRPALDYRAHDAGTSPLSLFIRPAIATDIAPLALVGHAAWRQGLVPLLPAAVHHRVTPADFAELVRELPHETLVAELDGRPVALAATELGDDEISDLWVSPDHTGRGLGSALLDAEAEIIRRRGYGAVRLQVMTENARALALYRRHGYVVTWLGTQFNPQLGIDIAKTHMEKPLV